jgi:heme/copper-type cytochrome/quinol oxidase subunit 3
VSAARTLDVSKLPQTAIDSRSLVWWGTVIMTVIETTVFAISVAAYFYLRMIANVWPPGRIGPPGLTAATVNLVLLLLSMIPAVALDRAGKRHDAGAVKLFLALNLVAGTAFTILRVFEFKDLHCKWNSGAYGSITWTILGLHLTNVLTSLLETAFVLAWFLFREPEDHHFLDARLDGVFWYFVVLTWIPLYFVVFIVPRL